MKTLIINAQPDFRNGDHYSIKLQQLFLKKFQVTFPKETVDLINLYDMEIPQLTTDQLLGIWEKQANHITLNNEEKRIFQINQDLIQQFKSHHRIVIVSPLHNFNVTSKMKDYIDNILVAHETFKYTAEGSVGLMTDNYRVMLLQASGSIYTNNDRYTPLEFSRMYLQGIFEELMGFDNFLIVRAQGLQTNGIDVSKAMEQAKNDLNIEFAKFYEQ
ncbi:putative acyl carrier protein phosphodiesterase (putative) [Companilactobacillus paralimentarius DSM 13238 = JCM 10415]|jgi:Acyl carrier protein phosphodiesterase|uniref:FMN dependent NADH:quinone oxidoreductase n=1 Tax=Companilactobacillus paralimentarius DSM 13238 = JCM 10415 TaxID=1122151 RepID=A0A0R1PK06_9LACO|nr:NAD(P)H-dependent oxidoreductase [Companilactobacillus paralimentarius]KAE9565213.1 FMN-dependent NADH-azoreductase [Companilactobacillus paralimentarius]KRL29339.1 putative acyl carrier protein phosphodiesterase (putative) [Companilactobacillus paralimentarius DSM 13238 = JCM 10415]MDR4932578.1 NAD(P)H-dependent oxidoreductase [Companilactobacillus paralimentarius]QFR69167.1 FMN-dependent NADH-azoreductase [Companilactobacillus paralimentarius]